MYVQRQLSAETNILNLPFQDINRTVPSQQNKTMGELILNLYDAGKNEMIFRHYVYGWNSDYHKIPIKVSVLDHMSSKAAAILMNLEDVMREVYGDEVGDIIGNHKSDMPAAPEGMITLEIKDKYLTGKSKCIIEGMDKLMQKHNPTQQKVIKKLATKFGVVTYEEHSIGTKDDQEPGGRLETADAFTALDRPMDDGADDDNSTFATNQTGAFTNLNEPMDDECLEDTPGQDASSTPQPISQSPQRPPTSHEDEVMEIDDDWRTKYIEKWGTSLRSDLDQYYKENDIEIGDLIIDGPIPGLAIDTDFFHVRGTYPSNVFEASQVVKDIFVGGVVDESDLSEMEEELKFRLMVGKLNYHAIDKAKEMGLVEQDTNLFEYEAPCQIPSDWHIDKQQPINADTRHTVYTYFGQDIMQHIAETGGFTPVGQK